jgi:hypothetical protein
LVMQKYAQPSDSWEDRQITNADVCQLFGLKLAKVHQLASAGVLPKADIGRYRLKPVVQAYVKHLLNQIEEVKLTAQKEDNSKARLAAVKAEMAEMELGLRTGKLIHVDRVFDIMSDCFANFAQRIQAIPTKAAPICAGEDAEAICETLQGLVTEALTELSTDALPRGADEAVRDKRGRGRPSGKIGRTPSVATQVDRVAKGR